VNVIECNCLTKAYRDLKALNEISINIQENKITGLIGRNGAGKTTLLKVIAGFLKKTSGDVTVFSENPFNNLKVSSNMIFIDDNMALPSALNLMEILECVGGFYENWDMRLAKRLFDYFSLNPNQYYLSLSKGMRSTINMIIGISAHCSLTIFDEPTIGMDAAVRKDFYKVLLKDYIEFPRTIIISSHHLNEIEDIIEDVLLIKEGKKYLHTSIEELKSMAIGLRGKAGIIEDFTKDKEILHKEALGRESLYMVVKNDLGEKELQKVRGEGVEISPVTVDDICVYLTAKSKGGIDDVFNRD
jgi:ABC-2 type transport system ATP-binding protein